MEAEESNLRLLQNCFWSHRREIWMKVFMGTRQRGKKKVVCARKRSILKPLGPTFFSSSNIFLISCSRMTCLLGQYLSSCNKTWEIEIFHFEAMCNFKWAGCLVFFWPRWLVRSLTFVFSKAAVYHNKYEIQYLHCGQQI